MQTTRGRESRRRRAVAGTALLIAGVVLALTLALPGTARAQERDPFAPVPTTLALEATTAPTAPAPTASTVPGPPPGGLAFSGPANVGLLALGIILLFMGLALTELFRPRLVRRG